MIISSYKIGIGKMVDKARYQSVYWGVMVGLASSNRVSPEGRLQRIPVFCIKGNSEIDNYTLWIHTFNSMSFHSLTLITNFSYNFCSGWVGEWGLDIKLYETIVMLSYFTNLSLIPHITFAVGGWGSGVFIESYMRNQ